MIRERVLDELARRPADYVEAKAQSERIDRLFGLDCAATEARVPPSKGDSHERWIGLPVQAMQTPYSELLAIVEELEARGLKREASWIDLGAGYGRLGLLLALIRPEAGFTGYELVGERVDEGRAALERIGAMRARLLTQDLADPMFRPAEADCYFIYDFGTREAVGKSLEDLRELARRRPIIVVARGRGTRSWIDRGHPWLSVVDPIHHEHYSLYFSSAN
jgi:hypothetical protein